MTPRDLHERASSIFLEVRDAPPDQRRRALQHAAAGDERLAREVISLLEHDQSIAAETPARAAVGSDDQPTSAHKRPAAPHDPAADAPARVGPYRVLGRIGRGGSGYVLLAEQDEPVRRRVAIKIVPHAAISPELAARFEVERAALERTDHPNIARILDAGRTADGLPYLVMDYVEGAPVTRFCRERSMPLAQRIELMLDVIDAVQHAHQRGVIHRDLKPGNILVSGERDAGAARPRFRPRVLDFGIAKPIAAPLGGDVTLTAGLPLGTPAYMAPEQSGSALHGDIDTRADVYALGAVLYELTCGRTPIELTGDALESLRRIREHMPEPASRVRARHAELPAADPAPRSLLTDLDCILARALEKSPSQRYATAAALADDLRRLLRREPIEARPPTLRYRAARFAQRNRTLVALGAAAALAIATGMVGLTLGLIEARRQQREAVNQTEAQREINRFLTDDLLAAASPEQLGENVTALELLHRASGSVDRRFAGRPLIAAAIHHTLGEAFAALGAFDDADRHLARAIELRRAAAGATAPETLRSEIAAAGVLTRRGRLDEADAALSAVIARARLLLPPSDPALLTALNDLGTVRETQDRAGEAIALLSEALIGRQQALGPLDPLVPMTMSNLAMAYERQGDDRRSLEMQLEALALAGRIEPPPRMLLIGLSNNVGATYQDQNRDREAEPHLRRAMELAQDWLGPEHPDTLTIKANFAGLVAELGDPDRALQMLDEVIAIRTRVLGPRAWDTLTSRFAYWNALYKAGRYGPCADGYIAFLPEAIAGLDDRHWFVAQTRAALALALLNADRAEEALPHAQKAHEQLTATYGTAHARTRGAASTLRSIEARLATASSP